MKLFCALLLMTVSHFSVSAQRLKVKINSINTRPNEVTIAINPKNPLNLVAGSNTRSFYYSTNGGATWSEGSLPPDTYGDPSVIFDADGRAYYAHLSSTYESIKVRTSDDGGKTWSQAAKLFGPSSDSARAGSLFKSSLQDKEWLAADITSGPYRGNIYASWTDFSKYGSSSPRDSSVIVFARSTNRGASFEPFVRVSDEIGDAIDSDNTMEGAVPAVGPDGEIYIAWAGPKGLYFDKSPDGGKTFGKDIVASAMPGGWDFDISGINRSNGLPITACDISNSPSRGTVYVNWSDWRYGDADVFIMKSTDRGVNWSQPIRVNNDLVGNGKQQFFTWMTVDPITGEIAIVFYDRRAYSGDSTDVYLASSIDGGATFTNAKLSDAAFYPTPLVFFGDYISIASYDGIIRPMWMELNNGVLNIFTQLLPPVTTAIDEYTMPGKIFLEQNYPNPVFVSSATPSRSITTIPYNLYVESHVRLSVYDLFGREIITLVNENQTAGRHTVTLAGSQLSPGTYIYRLQTKSFGVSRMMTCLR